MIKIKRVPLLVILALAILMLSGCGKKEQAKDEIKLPNPIEDPGGYIPGMVDVNKKAHQDIQNSVDKENKRLEDALNESGLKDIAR